MKSRAFLSLSLLAAALLSACGGGTNYDRIGSTSSVSGMRYSEENFQPRDYAGQETAPGLVFIEGGTFHMGGTENDIAYDRDNRTRQVTVASYYIDETEVANVDWKEFLFYIQRDSGEEKYDQLYPDTSVWYRDLAYNDPYVQYYFQHDGFNMYPVVGVSWYQCQEFCKWRTTIVNNQLTEKDPEAVLFPRYRLPTEAEWEYAARGLLEQQLYPWEGKSLRNIEGRFLANFKRGRGDYAGRSDKGGSLLVEGLNDQYMIPAPVGGPFPPNDFGLFHMSGNVSEWTEDTYRVLAYEDNEDLNPFRRKGDVNDPWQYDDDYREQQLSLLYNPGEGNPGEGDHDRVKVYRGGSWADVAYYLTTGSRRFFNADSSSALIGFRCAMTRVGRPY